MHRAFTCVKDTTRCLATRYQHVQLTNPARWTLTGYSKGSDATSLYLPEPGIMLDTGTRLETISGIESERKGKYLVPKTLLVTHRHSDHSKYVKWMAGQRIGKNRIVSPPIKKLRAGTFRSVDNPDNNSGFTLDNGIGIKVFELAHTVRSVGYGISLNDEKQIVMMGDTGIQGLIDNSGWRDYPVVVVECTSYNQDPEVVKRYRELGHISWSDIHPIIKKNPSINFCLIHSSSVIDKSMKPEMIDTLLRPNGLSNVFLWID